MDLSKLHLHWGECRRGKHRYRSYSLARAYRLNGKNRKEIVLKLGKLTDQEVERWRSALQAAKDPASSSDRRIVGHLDHLVVAACLETWNFWGLNEPFDSVKTQRERDIPLATLAAALAINRCIDPVSKSRVSSWFRKTTLPFLLEVKPSEVNPSRIFRELTFIEECKDQICQHLCKKMIEAYPEDMDVLFYDLSSTTFTGTRCLLVSWGHCKEGYENHVVLALVVNGKGLPIYWEVLEGGTADATTISWLLQRLQEKLPIAIPTMVFDRGMVSDENLSLLEANRVKYITAMDKNQIAEIAQFDFSQFEGIALDDVERQMDRRSDFIKLDETTYCKEVGVIGERRYVLCFNTQLFKDQRKARKEQIVNFESFVKEQNQELLEAKKHRELKATKDKFDTRLRKACLQGFVGVQFKEKYVPKQTRKMLKAILTYQASICVDEKKEREAGRLDGFWLLVTNHSEKEGDRFTRDTVSVVQPYRDKVVIESSFRDIKSFVEVAPVYVWKSEHVKAHYTICVLAHLINRTLTLRLHQTKGKKSSEIVSHERLYEELEECKLNRCRANFGPYEAYEMTEPTERQVELLERLGMRHLIGSVAKGELTRSALSSVTSK
jgi:transposase